jgi:hypothetical protein
MESQVGPTAIALVTPDAAQESGPGRHAPRVRRRGLPFMLAGLAVLAIVLVGAAMLANASLSQTYSAEQAVRNYFAALARRDAGGILANTTFLKGEGSFSYFFDKAALQDMLKLPANSKISDVRVTAVRVIDASSSSVTVSMSRNGKARTDTLTIRKDLGDSHWLFYPSWRVELPSARIQITLPNQAGLVSVDGIPAAGDSQTAIQVIPGFHRVSMAGTTLLDSASQDVDATDSPATLTLPGTIRASALDAAGKAVTDAMKGCDASKYDGCFNHTYLAPDRNFIYYFTLPGYGNINYTKYVNTLTDDPTAGMKLTVQADAGKVSVSGACAATVTVDGSRRYTLKGDFTGTLTWVGDGFGSDLSWDCEKAKG